MYIEEKTIAVCLDGGRFQLVNIYKGCYRSHDLLYGVSSKRSGKSIVAPNFLFIELETSNCGYLFIFSILLNCGKFEQDWTKLIY